MDFTNNLKILRKERHLSQQRLGEVLNISLKTISHWETGYTEPSIGQLISLADFFDISVDELIGRCS